MGIVVKDIDLGSSVFVIKVVSVSFSEIVVLVDVVVNVMFGLCDVVVGGVVLSVLLFVYCKVVYIKVMLEMVLLWFGGGKYFKGYGQFDVIGFDVGFDGKFYIVDDINIGVIFVDWSVQDLIMMWYDDDVKYVGKFSFMVLFILNVDGFNLECSGMCNNYGDVWIVVMVRNEKDSIGKLLIGKVYLVVIVLVYK